MERAFIETLVRRKAAGREVDLLRGGLSSDVTDLSDVPGGGVPSDPLPAIMLLRKRNDLARGDCGEAGRTVSDNVVGAPRVGWAQERLRCHSGGAPRFGDALHAKKPRCRVAAGLRMIQANARTQKLNRRAS